MILHSFRTILELKFAKNNRDYINITKLPFGYWNPKFPSSPFTDTGKRYKRK